MAEEILIKIEIEKGENEKQIDDLTKKITNLQAANHSLQNEQKELIKQGKQNSEQYIENSRQIEINKQKINESASSRKNLITTIIAEDNSIKGLRARNAELIKQRDQLSTATEEGRRAIAEINQELDKNNKTIKDNVSAQEKQRLSVGGYTDALDKLVPGLGATVNGIQAATKAAWAFIATPLGAIIGALGLAIAAIVAYFKSSETAQNRWNKVVAVGGALLEQLMNVVENLGEILVDAFTNPRQALVDFGNFIKENLFNRFEGLLELIPELGKAIGLLFEGEFAEAGQVALDAVVKVGLGVENATEKIQGLIETTAGMVEEGIRLGERIANLNAEIDREERRLIVERDRLALEVSRKRQEAVEQEGEQKRKTIKEAIALERSLSDAETELARKRLALRQTELEANGDDKEALKAVAEARAAVFRAEATAFDNTLKFRKQLEALDEEEFKKLEDDALFVKALREKEVEEEKERQERIREALIETENLRLEQAILKAESDVAKVEAEIALEQFKVQTLLENEKLLQSERELIIAQGQAKVGEILVNANEEHNKKVLAADKKLSDEKKKLRAQEVAGINASLDAAVNLSKQAFGENKAIAIAETVINTVRGIVRALADYGFPYNLIVAGLVGAAGTVQTAKLAGITFSRGGIAKRGGLLRGHDHSRGGIPFSVAGQQGFEAEGGEAIINKKSTRMFRKQLSDINQAGGGVKFATGGILGSQQTQQASIQAQNRTAVQDAVELVMRNMPPIIVTVESFNAVADEVATTQQRAQVIP